MTIKIEDHIEEGIEEETEVPEEVEVKGEELIKGYQELIMKM